MNTTLLIWIIVVLLIVGGAWYAWTVVSSRRAAAEKAVEHHDVDPAAEQERKLEEARELREAMVRRAERREHEAEERVEHQREA